LVIHQLILIGGDSKPGSSGTFLRKCSPPADEKMNTKMYVGNLSFDTGEQDLRELFGAHGGVTDVFLPVDRDTKRPRGFAFVTMDSAEAMNAAIAAINGQEFQGRRLTVNEARPQTQGGGGGGGGGGGFRRGGGGGGGGRGGYGGGGGRDRY
jgi:RNA recognition motif-containing protein